MGPCVTKQNNNNCAKYESRQATQTVLPKPQSKFTELEQLMLDLMYDDLAKRCKGKIVTRDTFQSFFHSNGLMAELMFTKFDEKRAGVIGKDDFKRAFELMVKGTFEEKAEALFDFYRVEKSKGIGYGQLLRILFSYPLEELNKMLFEEKFLEMLGDRMIAYYFGPEKKILEKTIIEDVSESSHEFPPRKGSLYCPNSSEAIDIQCRIQQMFEDQQKTRKGNRELPEVFKKESIIEMKKNKKSSKGPQVGSMTLIELKKIRKSCQLKSNISSVTKRYATYLFASLNLDKENDVLSKKQFCDLLRAHPSIFDVYLAGFHTYIWQNNVIGLPEYVDITPDIEGEAKQWNQSVSKPVYLRLVKTTILVFQSKNSSQAKEVICLEGLMVESIQESQQAGIVLKHRDCLYPKKIFTFQSSQPEWLKKLQDYKQNSIFEDYLKLERIGKGNFSNVYRGKQKKTNNFVAIKVIEPESLKDNQRQVLKREIGILKQCHHPNIVKFIETYQTSTQIYIVTELLTQGDLFEYTRKNSFLQEYEASIIFRQLTQAILYLNEELGIIHRDLKPENVMIKMGEDKKMVRRIKLIDFGFGVYKDQLNDMNEDEKYAGTPGFIPPEVYERKGYDFKLDTFSLGIILYFLLYGYLPFQSNYIQEIEEQTRSCKISLKNNHWSNVSEEAKDLIYKILTDADNRITTKQILEHPWLKETEKLKEFQGRNKKRMRILD